MYRDVEQGMGIFESPIHISLEGLRLPWLKTLENMGYLDASDIILPILIGMGALIWALWNIGSDKFQTRA